MVLSETNDQDNTLAKGIPMPTKHLARSATALAVVKLSQQSFTQNAVDRPLSLPVCISVSLFTLSNSTLHLQTNWVICFLFLNYLESSYSPSERIPTSALWIFSHLGAKSLVISVNRHLKVCFWIHTKTVAPTRTTANVYQECLQSYKSLTFCIQFRYS